MSLIRQVWLVLIGVIVAATLGSVLSSVWTATSYLSTQLALKNNDNAQSLALALSQSAGDPTMTEMTVAAQFDTGFYRAVRFRGPDGKLLVNKEARPREAAAPAWFVQVVPLEAAPGVAAVTNGWKQLGTVELESQVDFAYESLWHGCVRMAAWIAFVGACAALVARWGVRRLSGPLDAVVEQAGALIQRRFVTIEEPKTPELRRVSRAMNAMVERVRAMFSEQSDQLEALRLQANCDLMTGVPHRSHFMAAFAEVLQREDGATHGGLYLIRVEQLADVNRKLGRARTDELLKRLAQLLAREAVTGNGTVGRLNGSDFALLLPGVQGLSRSGGDLLARLQADLSDFDGAAVVGSGAEWHRGDKVSELLSTADLALARAEARGAYAFEVSLEPRGIRVPMGEEAWRQGLVAAIDERRVRLVGFPVLDGKGHLLHYECPLRIQLLPDGDYEPAARWLPYALRTGQVARSDEVAVQLALDAITRDGVPRGVNVSPLSLQEADFVPRLRQLVAQHHDVARLLWIEVDEAAVDEQTANLEELCRALRPLGVKLGLEHAGHRIAHLGKVLDAGLDYVKLAASVTGHLESDDARAAHVRGIASILHGMGVAVYAEGVNTPGDLAALWRCRIDGVTGPAVALPT